jgi:hypothetical protein
VPILVAFRIALALGDQLFVMRHVFVMDETLRRHLPKSHSEKMEAALNKQWRLSNIAHPRGLSSRFAQGFFGRSVDEIQSHRGGGDQ